MTLNHLFKLELANISSCFTSFFFFYGNNSWVMQINAVVRSQGIPPMCILLLTLHNILFMNLCKALSVERFVLCKETEFKKSIVC
jgi:hypothetical protein